MNTEAIPKRFSGVVQLSKNKDRFQAGSVVIALLTAAIFLIAAPLHALEHSGPITTDETWYAVDNPHIVVGTVTVNAGVTLTIEDGVTVRTDQNRSITVEGTLTASGTLGTGILFTQNGTSGWEGLRFNGSGTGSLEYCTIEEAVNGVRAAGGPVQLTSTTFRNNNLGFFGDGVAPTFMDASNVFEDNSTGIYLLNVTGLNMTTAATIRGTTTAGIELSNCSSATLDNLTFTGNVGTYGAIYAILSPDFTLGAGNTFGGSGLENSWPVTLARDAYPSASSTLPPSGNTNNAIQVTGAGLSYYNNANTWPAIGVDYVVTGNPTISASGSLTIEDGVTVRTDQNRSITVEGTLTASGTLGTGILFTQNGTSGWEGLRFNGSGTGSLEYCTIEEAVNGVRAAGGPVQLTSTTFRNNNLGFFGDGVAPTFMDASNVFEDNSTGIYLLNVTGLNMTTAATIRGTTTAGIELSNCSSATLDNLTFTGNVGTYGAIFAILSPDFTLGAGNTFGGSGLENSWPVTLARDAYPSASSTLPPSGNTNNAIQVTGAGLSYYNNANTWPAIGVDYVVTGNPTISASGSLTIEDGVTVRTDQNRSITVEGTLTASGTLGTGILFTQNGTSGWEGLRFNGSGTGSLEYCTIEEAVNGVRAAGGPVQLTSTTFRNNNLGFFGDGVAPTFMDASNVFEDNSTGIYLLNVTGLNMTTAATIRGTTTAGIELSNCSSATLDNLTFTGNVGTYGAIYAILSPDFTLGAGNTFGGSGLENSWPVTLARDAYPSASSTLSPSGNTNNAIQVTGAGLSYYNNANTWPAIGVDYVVTGNPTISASGSLTIEDGVTVRTDQNRSITVEGTLTASGTLCTGILFTQNGTSGWEGLRFNGSGTGSLEYCTIEEAVNGVRAAGGPVQLTSTTLSNNSTGVYASKDTITFRNNQIINNTSYGVYLTGASPDFGTTVSEWNDIYDNGGGTPGRDLRNGSTDINAHCVYWGTIVESEIQDMIWDKNDDSNLGVVNYSPWSNETHDGTHTGVTYPTDKEETIPTKFALSQNYPNPFNPTTTIRYELPRPTSVVLRIYDVSGRLVRALLDGEVVPAGRRHITWNGKDEAGNSVASGIYFYRLTAGDFEENKRMVLIR